MSGTTPSLQHLPPELVLLIFNSLTRLQDAVTLARTCKKTYALFARLEDRARIIYSIVENIPTSLPQRYPSKPWLELHFPPDTRFWIPRKEQLPSGLEDEKTINFLTAVGVPVFECGRIDFESTETLPSPVVTETGRSESDNDNGDNKNNNKDWVNDDGGDDDGKDDTALVSAPKEDEPARQLQSSEASDSDSDSDSESEEEEIVQSERGPDSEESDSGEEELLFLGTWYSQSIALDPSSGFILHHNWDSDENEVIAESVGRFLVLLGVIRSVVCGLRECGLQPEQRTEHADIEGVVLESLFEGLGRVDGCVKEAGFWEWICNYVSS